MFEIRKIKNKRKGVFATRKILKGEHIFHKDLTKLPSYTLDEISKHPLWEEYSDHSDYLGNGKYVIDISTTSYINHSCDPIVL